MSEQKQDPYAKYRTDLTPSPILFGFIFFLFFIVSFFVESENERGGPVVRWFAGGATLVCIPLALLSVKRRFHGYNLCYFRRGDKTETEVVYRPAMNIFLEREKGLVLSVPLGGWFNKPKVYAGGVKHLWQVSWKERCSGAIGLFNDSSTLWILSFRGEKYGPFPANEAFNEICEMERLGSQVGLRGYLMAARGESVTQSGKALAQFRSSLETTENARAKLIHLFREAADRLGQTQRLKYSREGKPFTLWLVTALCEFLAKDGEGREKYEAMLAELQASKAKPPEPPPEAPAAVPATTPTSPTTTA